MLSVRPINEFTPRSRSRVSYTPRLIRTTKMVVSCSAFGCANRFGALQGHFLKDFQNFRVYQEAIDFASEAPRLDPIEILERIQYVATILYQESEMSKSQS